jgi:hypothetical protein
MSPNKPAVRTFSSLSLNPRHRATRDRPCGPLAQNRTFQSRRKGRAGWKPTAARPHPLALMRSHRPVFAITDILQTKWRAATVRRRRSRFAVTGGSWPAGAGPVDRGERRLTLRELSSNERSIGPPD